MEIDEVNALGDYVMTKQGRPNHGRRSKTNTLTINKDLLAAIRAFTNI
jgi:hypothetical protein